MAAVPTIREYLLEIMRDPDTPGSIKRIVKRSLEDENAKIENLTQDLRQIRNIDDRMDAFVEIPDSPFLSWMYEHETPSVNQEASAKSKPSPSDIPATSANDSQSRSSLVESKTFRVSVPDRPTSADINDLNSLIHELSHIRMQAFLHKKWRQIFTSQTGYLVLEAPNGKLGIHLNLVDMIQEKYAHETELSLYKSSQSKHFPQWTQRWEKLSTLPPEHASILIGLYVSDTYKIANPIVRALAIEPLSKTLLSAKLTQEISDFLDFYNELSAEPLAPTHAPLVVALLRMIKNGQGKAITRQPTDSEIKIILSELLQTEKGRKEVKHIVSVLRPYLKTHAPTRTEAIFRSREIRSFLLYAN